MEASPKDFVSERILKAVIADEERLQRLAECKHEEAKYLGHKTCCSKCGANFKKGHGFEWSLK